MRIVNEVGLNFERKSSFREPRAKFIIIPEGDCTEIQYFNGIWENRKSLGIHPLLEVILIGNVASEHGQSFPLQKIENFKKMLCEEKIVYDSTIDKVYFVVDRDKQNFKSFQYKDFLKQCSKNGFLPIVSNPTFEFFLLLHDSKILLEDRELLFSNSKVNKNKRYLEELLSKYFGCNKRNLFLDKFMPYVKLAIKNEKEFCENIEELESCLGSNVGLMLEEMMSTNKV